MTVDGGDHEVGQSDAELLAIHVDQLYTLTEGGRIGPEHGPDRSPGPRLYLGGCDVGNVARIGHEVGDETARALEALVVDEPPLRDRDSTPIHLDGYIELLAGEAPVEEQSLGLVYQLPNDLGYEHDVALIASGTPEGDRLLAGIADGGMPRAMVEVGFLSLDHFWPPWCVALHEGEIASIAFAVRTGAAAAEIGLNTMPAFRGRGFGPAATAGWTSHSSLRGLVLFYSTERTNLASQRVAGRLGLRFIGASLRLR